MRDLNQFFNPKSIAVLGASREPTKLGNQLVKNILNNGFIGRVYPINPNADSIYDLKCYSAINKIHEIPDLTLISLPTPLVYESLKAAIDFGCNNFIIITAGFREIGEEGTREEERIKDLIKSYPNRNINVLGPNCLGFLNTKNKLNASFAANFPIEGKAKFISQSGALCTAVLDWSQNTKVGFSDFISVGNKADLDENELLEYWYEQNRNSKELILSPIFAYLESFNDGQRFLEIAKKITAKVPLVVLKPGKFDETKSAMSSHTGSLASDDRVTDQAFKQSGVIRIDGLHDMYDLMMAFDWSILPKGKNVAIVSNAGGPGILTTDYIKEQDLNIAKFSESTTKQLMEKLPRTANVHDPVDVIGDALADRYGYALDIVLGEPNVDAVVVLLTPQAMTQIRLTAEYIARLSKTHNKTVVASFMGGKKVAEAEEVLSSAKIPYFAYPERAVYAISKMYEYNKYKTEKNTPNEIDRSLQHGVQNLPKQYSAPFLEKVITKAKLQEQEYLFADDAEKLLSIYGIPVATSKMAASKEEAVEFFEEQYSPIVMKLSSPYLVHKSDSGGVVLGLDSKEKIHAAFESLFKQGTEIAKENPMKETFKIQCQKMTPIRYELIVGTKRDPNFGPTILFGMGGIYAEIFNDTSLRVLPINDEEAEKMINETKISKILHGARGGKSEDLKLLSKVLLNISTMVLDNPVIKEVDLNPVVITKEGQILVLDAKVRI